ncbi:hypothetical protein P7D59_19480 [Enterococcus avium]|uniref:hypothetical protein n=1 Tax=Enterococcus avium TaxID=33945 RepID=UPI001C1DE218|nr:MULTISPECIES: hypothetical protein [Enterococcus]MDT2481106.1 hypothetical protein [Enterococcus avium]
MSIYTIEELEKMKKFFLELKKIKIRVLAKEFVIPRFLIGKNISPVLFLLDQLMVQNKYVKKNNIKKNYKLLSQLICIFFIHHKQISSNLHKTFWHEFGHIYNALTEDFEFTALILKDLKNNCFYLFHLNPENTNEILFSQSSISLFDRYTTKNSKGIALYYNPNPDVIEFVALGGFMQDFVIGEKTKKELLNSFGLNQFTLKARKNSDFNYIEKNINYQLYKVNTSLYYPTNKNKVLKRFKGYPLRKFRDAVFLKSNL